MRSSTSSGSLVPPYEKNLMPLSGAGLCDAEIITPKSALMESMRNAAAGVGMTPASSTSTPELARPAETAAVRNSPLDARVASDDRHRAAAGRAEFVGVAPLGEDGGSRLGQAQGQVSREFTVGQTPDPVGSEKPRHEESLEARISASRTAEPCGPS